MAERFAEYNKNPLMIDMLSRVPFYQVLSSITGSGKTTILCQSIENINALLGVPPVVLWVSKGKVVVDQTLNNLRNGRYAPLISSFRVKPLLECTQGDLERADQGLLLVATVGKFNQKDRGEGDRKVFQAALDQADQSLWEQLKARRTASGFRRPLIVVYDEGHNLSDQQTGLILELAPEALIAASATVKYPVELGKTISRLKQDKHWKDSDFQVVVNSKDVVDEGLVKKFVKVDGFTTPMEQAIDVMLDEFQAAAQSAEDLGLPFQPKAIYVSKTNVMQTTKRTENDDIHRAFQDRRARPILIWRYLTEQKGINPDEIAVYLDLKFDRKFPPPDHFHLFSQGDDDYYRFIQGNYRHIIFNLSLQEGWDDPECSFAYIDKDMGSPTQVAQVIGRVLRQPGGQHYTDDRLNTANFYIRTDERGTFQAVLGEIRKKIAVEAPEIQLILPKGSASSGDKSVEPVRKHKEVPVNGINTAEAKTQIDRIIDGMMDHRGGGINTEGRGSTIKVLQQVGSEAQPEMEWVEVPHSNLVTARWVFLRELEYLENRAVNLCPLTDPKFDARIEFGSRAADEVRRIAHQVAEAYLEWSEVKVKAKDNPYVVQPITVDPGKCHLFKNSIHACYSGLNDFEKDFADALDKTQRTWARNPVKGYGIHLLDGKSNTFYPDFLIWADKDVIAIDTKGDHLIYEDSHRKLLNIKSDGIAAIHIRLITEGEWTPHPTPARKPGTSGYTVWKLKDGKPMPVHTNSASEALDVCLKIV